MSLTESDIRGSLQLLHNSSKSIVSLTDSDIRGSLQLPPVNMVQLTAYNVALACFVGLGGVSYGYAFSVFATSIGQPGFYQDLNLDRE